MVDFTSPNGILQIKEILIEEGNRDILIIKKIVISKSEENIAVACKNGLIKILTAEGRCISKIVRKDNSNTFCMEIMEIPKYYSYYS